MAANETTGKIARWWRKFRFPPRCEVVDLSKMDDQAVADFYSFHFPGRFTKADIDRGVGRNIDWSAVQGEQTRD